VKKLTLSLFLLSVAISPAVLAQDWAKPLRVTSCLLSDSLLGGINPDGRVMGLYDAGDNSTMIATEPERIWRRGFGLRGITASAHFEGRGQPVAPVVQLDIKLVEPEERSIDQRQLLLVLNDSTRLDLGSMSTNPQRLPSVPGVTQNMSIVLSMTHALLLTRANRVTGTIGTTSFALTKDQHRNFQTLYIALVCGVPIGQ
jgi:hypothetical protein